MSNPPFRNTQPSAPGGEETELAARRQAGALLRAAREAAGRSLGELATQLKVSADKISALETGDWDLLHDPAHARGLLRAAAKAVRADADEVLRPLPPVFVRGSPILPTPGVTMGPARPAAPVGTHGSGHRLVWLGLLVVVVALGLMLLPRAERLGHWAQQLRAMLNHHAAAPTSTLVVIPASRSASQAAGTASAVAPSSAALAAPAAASAAASAPALRGAPADAGRPGNSPASPAAGAAPAARSPVAGAASSAAPAGSAATAAAGPPGPLLNLSASAQSWVRVRSQAGRVLFTGLLAPGASQDVATRQGDFPLHVTVGNAAQTRVSLGGRPVAIQAGGDNVARLVLQGATP